MLSVVSKIASIRVLVPLLGKANILPQGEGHLQIILKLLKQDIEAISYETLNIGEFELMVKAVLQVRSDVFLYYIHSNVILTRRFPLDIDARLFWCSKKCS